MSVPFIVFVLKHSTNNLNLLIKKKILILMWMNLICLYVSMHQLTEKYIVLALQLFLFSYVVGESPKTSSKRRSSLRHLQCVYFDGT